MVRFSYLNKEWPLSSLRCPFPGVEDVEHFPSGCGHDLFVLQTLNGKRNGRYLELGSRDPIKKSNTYVLEKYFDWEGISLDINPAYYSKFNSSRINKTILQDATTADYNEILSQFDWDDKIVDYLSVDCDPSPNSFAALKKVLESGYTFRVITFEHDHYGPDKHIKALSRNFIWSHGYTLKANMSTTVDHEDWWVLEEIDSTSTLELTNFEEFFFHV